jgi:hypothetical protein
MLNNEVKRFLEKPRIARLATIGTDGYPHIVPIYFMLDGDELIFATERSNRKVKNAISNPRGAVQIGGERTPDEAGYMIQGDLRIEEDVDRSMTRRLLTRYETKKKAEKSLAQLAGGELILIRLKPRSVIRVL